MCVLDQLLLFTSRSLVQAQAMLTKAILLWSLAEGAIICPQLPLAKHGSKWNSWSWPSFCLQKVQLSLAVMCPTAPISPSTCSGCTFWVFPCVCTWRTPEDKKWIWYKCRATCLCCEGRLISLLTSCISSGKWWHYASITTTFFNTALKKGFEKINISHNISPPTQTCISYVWFIF